MKDLYIHEATRNRLERMATALPHGLLLAGAEGVGLASIATWLTSKDTKLVTWVLPERNEKVDLEKGTITIDSIRKLYDQTKTIEPKGRIVIIDFAERMASGAQNAFLKLLEEPNQYTHFILLSHTPGGLLPTITSRVQTIEVQPATLEQSNQLLDELKVFDITKRAQLLFIAQGLPAELQRLVADDSYFENRASIVKDARTLIVGTPYDKLLLAKKYKDDRGAALTLLDDAAKQLKTTIAKDGSEAGLQRLAQLDAIYERIVANGNIRLQLGAAAV